MAGGVASHTGQTREEGRSQYFHLIHPGCHRYWLGFKRGLDLLAQADQPFAGTDQQTAGKFTVVAHLEAILLC